MTFDPNIQPSVLAAQLRAQAPVADAPAPAPEVDTTPEDEAPITTLPEGDDLADTEDERDLVLAQREKALEARERALEEKGKQMERGVQKRFQQAAEERKQLREARKASREVEFLVGKMGEIKEFGQDFVTLANTYGVHLPDVSKDDVEERIAEAKEEILERMEQEKFEVRKASYQSVLDSEEARMTKEHGLTPGEWDKILAIAQDEDVPLMRQGMTPAQVVKALNTAANNYLFPRAAANGQRRLISRTRDKVRSAAAHAGAPTPTPTLRAKGFNEDPRDVLAKIRGT